MTSPLKAAGSASILAFESSQVRFPGPAHSFTSCQRVKGRAVSIGLPFRLGISKKSMFRISFRLDIPSTVYHGRRRKSNKESKQLRQSPDGKGSCLAF